MASKETYPRGRLDPVSERARLSEEIFEGRKITVSVGASAFPTHGTSSTELIAAADVALYAAKDAGRDRVMPAEPPE